MADGQDQLNSEETALDRLVAQIEPEKTEPDPTDPDAIEEAEAQKALAAEEAKEKEEKAPEAKEPEEPEKEKPKTPMIPKPRFDEVAATAAYWKGIADERGRQLAAKAEPESPEPTPEQQISEIRGQIKALAKEVDDGKLLMSDFEDKRQALLDQELAIRDQMRKPTEVPKRGSDLYLEQRTTELEASHPYVAALSPDDLAFLTRKAVAALAEEGVTLPKGDLDPSDQLVLRTKIAVLSDTYGPVLTGKELKATGKPALSRQAKNLQTKLQDARDAPPDLTAAGRGGAPMEYTDAQILAMSQEDLDALPMGTLEKIMARQQT
jgi:hypothetical protein